MQKIRACVTTAWFDSEADNHKKSSSASDTISAQDILRAASCRNNAENTTDLDKDSDFEHVSESAFSSTVFKIDLPYLVLLRLSFDARSCLQATSHSKLPSRSFMIAFNAWVPFRLRAIFVSASCLRMARARAKHSSLFRVLKNVSITIQEMFVEHTSEACSTSKPTKERWPSMHAYSPC